MGVAGQVLASVLLVIAVLAFMWRLPRRGEALFGWAPPLALLAAWSGLFAAALSAALWALPYPDRWLATVLLFFDPASLASGTLVLWIYRGEDGRSGGASIAAQRTQAWVGIGLGAAGVVLGYLYVMSHKTPFTPIGA